MTIRIFLADDHKLMRDGLRRLINDEPNMTVVGEASDGRTAVQEAASLAPDIVIMDISMPGMNGIEATRQIRAANPETKVIALSMHFQRRLILEMVNAGAAGYLLKDCAFDEVIHAVRAVAEGSTYLSSKITDLVLDEYVRRIPKGEMSELSALTPREREIFQLVAEGKNTKEIAEILEVSSKTVEFHRKQVMEKLNAHSVADLTKIAIHEGLIPL